VQGSSGLKKEGGLSDPPSELSGVKRRSRGRTRMDEAGAP
jgi:hypothetical protein